MWFLLHMSCGILTLVVFNDAMTVCQHGVFVFSSSGTKSGPKWTCWYSQSQRIFQDFKTGMVTESS